MIVDAIALIVLSGMMLVPLINLVVGLIVGAWLGGPVGALAGFALAVLITAFEKRVGDQLGWLEPEAPAEEVPLNPLVRTPSLRDACEPACILTPVWG